MVPLPEINPWLVRHRVGMGVSVQILEKSLCKGINGRKYLHFNNFCQLQLLVLYVYPATSTAHKSIYSLKSHQGSLLHMYEGDM